MANREQHHWKDNWKGKRSPVKPMARKAVRILRESKGKEPVKILDLGCGDGRDSLYFARKGHAVTSIDFSESGVATLQEHARKEGLNIDARLSDISQRLPYRNGTFDAVFAHLSLHYFDDAMTDRVFAEVHRVLKRGGMFFVKCKSVDDPLYGKGKKIGEDTFVMGHIRHFFSKEYLREKLRYFYVKQIRRGQGNYDSVHSCFVEAVAEK